MVISIYYIVVKMVTKQEVKEYYAENRKDSNQGMCSPFVEKFLEGIPEDKTGIYTLAGELIGTRDYYTMDQIKNSIRAAINQYIKDLKKVTEI